MNVELKNNIPELRFSEFSEEWVEKKLGEIAEKIGSGKTPRGGVYVYSKQGIPFIRSQNINNDRLVLDETHISEDIHSNMKGSTVYPNDILLNITGASIGRSCVVPKDFIEGNVNQHVCIIRLREGNSNFYQSIISSSQGQKLIFQGQTGSGREGLNFKSIRNFKFVIPNSPTEQTKIATFLTAVDKRIKLLQKKKAELEQYKKGVMQGLFVSNHDAKDFPDDPDFKNQGNQNNQEKSRFRHLRFKPALSGAEGKEDGSDFPDWEVKKLGEVCEIKKGKQLNKEELEISGTYPAINGGIKPSGYTEEWNTIENTITISEGGNSCGYINFIKTKFWSGGHCYSLIKLGKEVETSFLYQLLKNSQSKIMRLRVGSGLPNIQKGEINNFKILIPKKDEQQKIATFLSSIDKSIENIANQIDDSVVFKKGLLQKMFV